MKYLVVLFLLSLQALLTKVTYDLGYNQGKLDLLDDFEAYMQSHTIINEPEDPFGDGDIDE